MKLYLGLMCAMMLIISSCTSHDMDQERQHALNDLESFRDSVETVVNEQANVNWAAVQAEYNQLADRANKAFEGASEDMNTTLNNVEEDVQSSIKKWKAEGDDLNAEADERMNNLEQWWEDHADESEDAMEEAGENVQDGYENTKEWIDTNWDNLKEGTRERWNRLKEKMDNSENNRS